MTLVKVLNNVITVVASYPTETICRIMENVKTLQDVDNAIYICTTIV